MQLLKRSLAVLAVLLLLAAGALAWLLQQHPALSPYAALAWKSQPPQLGLKVSFLGVATVLLDDGETAILTDGFFSRPDKLKTFLGKVEPDLEGITRGLKRAGIPDHTGKLAAVIPVHSHYDHAMDAPEVALRTGALLLGSASTANVGRGWGLPETQIRLAKLGVPMTFGRFTVTLLPSRHAPTGFTGGQISQPLKPPVRASDYKEGQSYAVLVQHAGKSLLINGSAGFEPGALKGVQADVVLLGIGSLGPRDDAYRDAYWREVVTAVKAKRVIPIHWDDFWLPSDQPMKPMPPPLDQFERSMDFLRARGAKEGVDIRLPLEWRAMDVWNGL
ncbi:MBL fold metallo-hydrolase [Polaromonas sp.]|uniref:MBL fold metallo-hydrolase n=1 Tax=Polaromonas sp. TaxID=1869339 RepID=UPI002FC7AE7A